MMWFQYSYVRIAYRLLNAISKLIFQQQSAYQLMHMLELRHNIKEALFMNVHQLDMLF